ncbi:unnamed protein product [Prorocentrum cordatum]|uniref:CSD domain-containing protein n=1 Tax=Prorocentrum cordatum TaxID=2364126 RepID=A0ABN9W017_9DINO|nr:unnamed protein product [Polarella glacialis]
MSTSASALAQTLAQHGDEDIAQAVQLFISLRPDFRELLAKVIEEEPIPRYNGTVVSFNREKGFGFLQSDQVTAEFGKDAFCSSNEIGDFRVGSEVTFTVIVNKNNQPQARLLQGPDGSVPQEERGVEVGDDEERRLYCGQVGVSTAQWV